ncbi:MAG TPA: phosphopentomutase, partial [Ruminococcaceae bacterium]|nr:phosphopentomutase [Oscillospiraceae bacterium]
VHPRGSFGKLAEQSVGKDTTTGHWEIAGIVSSIPMPTFPQGFSSEVLHDIEQISHHHVLCNAPYSGTKAIEEYGEEHQKTGNLIVYTSADSVLQIAAHESVISLKELYRICAELRKKLQTGPNAVGRIIARPFTGVAPHYIRSPHRRDFSLLPPRDTMLTQLNQNRFDTIGVGKISDIFATKGIQKSYHTENNQEGMEQAMQIVQTDFNGLCFINLVDFDMLFGHRNDVNGYANAVSVFDTWLNEFLAKLHDEDVLLITADHGCDPSTPSTDHSREYIPLLAYGKSILPGHNLGVRSTFADIGATILDLFNLPNITDGISFKKDIFF